jgi:hypothetical protein
MKTMKASGSAMSEALRAPSIHRVAKPRRWCRPKPSYVAVLARVFCPTMEFEWT